MHKSIYLNAKKAADLMGVGFEDYIESVVSRESSKVVSMAMNLPEGQK